MEAITVIIPNFNGEKLLRQNLPSVVRQASNCDAVVSIVVVDDGSSDNSVGVLKECFPEIQIVIHQKNKGFAEAVASGVKAAKNEMLFLLNSDVELVEDIFTPLMAYFQDVATFSVCPLMRNELGEISRHSWNRRQIIGGRLKLAPWDLANAIEGRAQGKLYTVYSSGGSMMVRKSMLLKLGCFHPIFQPFYGEDFDLGLRAWSRGWPSYFEPNVHVIHQDKGSIEENTKRRWIKTIKRRNRYYIEWMHFPLPRLLFSTAFVSVFQLFGEVLLIDRANIKGFLMAIKSLPSVYRARKDLEESRILTLSQIIEKVSPN